MSDNTRFQQAVSFLPLFAPRADDLINRSLQRYLAGDFKGCIQAAGEALRLNPNLAVAYNNMCASWNSLGEFNKAVLAGKRAVALNPDDTMAKNNLAVAKSHAGTGH